MDEFVGGHPVSARSAAVVCSPRRIAGEGGKAAHAAPGGALEDSGATGGGNDEDAGAGDGEFAVVGSDGGRGGVDVGEDSGEGKVERPGGDIDLEDGAADVERMVEAMS